MTEDRPGYPYAQTAVARYLDRRIDELRGVRTQREIAAEAGFNKPNIISMLKSGQSMLPLDKIPGMARALGVDPAHLYRLAMEDRWPEMKTTISLVFGGRQMATLREAETFLFPWRIATNNMDPMLNAEALTAIREMLGTMAKTSGF